MRIKIVARSRHTDKPEYLMPYAFGLAMAGSLPWIIIDDRGFLGIGIEAPDGDMDTPLVGWTIDFTSYAAAQPLSVARIVVQQGITLKPGV